MDKSVMATLAFIFGAIVTASVAYVGHHIARSNAKMQVKLTANLKLAEMRQNWINNLRDDMAAFQSIGILHGNDPEHDREFYRLGTKIELFLNPNDPEYPDLLMSLYKFLGAPTQEARFDANQGFIDVCQRILKAEWDKLKYEIADNSGCAAPIQRTPGHG